jgi:hypothetical protein
MQRNIFPQFKVNELKKFPIPSLNLSKKDDIRKKDRLVTLVDKMLGLQVENQHNSVQLKAIRQTDDEIDRFVYSLYDLAEEEINIITATSNEVLK